MKEILVVTIHLSNGGAERVLSELISEWVRTDNKVSIVQMRPETYEDSYNLPAEVEIINMKNHTENRFMRRIYNILELCSILKDRKNTIAVAFVNPAILILAACSLFVNNKIIFSERCDPNNSPPKKSQRKVRDWVYNLADACVFQTEDAKNHFSKRVQKRGTVICNPMNPELPQMYEGERKKTVVAACQLSKQKNIPMMIQAFVKFNKEYPDYVLEIYGRGNEEEMLRNMIKELGMTDKIFLCGFAENIYEKMLNCAMYVSSSDYEGISNSMLEALGMGIPTISTDCPIGGARMMINDGENGVLVPVGDSEALYEAMKKIVENPKFAEKISRNAYKLREELQISHVAEKWLEVMK